MSQYFEICSFGSTADLYAEYVKRSEPFSMPAEHYHNYYEIYYLMSGKRIYFIRDRSYSIEQGDLVFIGKQDVHKTMQTGGASHERFIIHFTDEWLRATGGSHVELLLSLFRQRSNVIRLPREQQLAVDAAIRGMLIEMREQEPGCELLASQAVTRLLLTAARHVRLHEPIPFQHVSPLHAKISDIVRYINENYAEELRLSELADRFFISQHYLSRMFKEVTGFTFSDYIALTRVKEAQRLLRETGLTITDIAEQVGFDNFSHFGKTFKRIVGSSPREYRKSMSLY